MSNIHGFGSTGDNNNNRRNNQPQSDGQDGIFSMLNGQYTDKDPRSENFCDMMTYSFCPTFTWTMFTTLAALGNGAIYILSILLSGLNMAGSFLEVRYGWLFSSFSGEVGKCARSISIGDLRPQHGSIETSIM